MTAGGFIALTIIMTLLILLFIEFAGMPAREAKKRNHPHAEAIGLLGWLGLPFGGIPWLVAMVWARMPAVEVSVKRLESVSESSDEPDTANDTKPA